MLLLLNAQFNIVTYSMRVLLSAAPIIIMLKVLRVLQKKAMNII